MEIWKNWPKNPKYLVSNTGKIKGIYGKELSPSYDKDGYLRLNLQKDGKSKKFAVHRVVAETFLENFSEDCIIDHINGIRNDNCINNLRIVDTIQNTRFREGNNKPIFEEVRRIIEKYGYDFTLKKLREIE